ncbi:MAG: hypothetical protein R2909_18145 [Gemmatimonadales bacterium]
MYTYQLQAREFDLRGATFPPFPRQVRVVVDLRPQHLFGGLKGPMSVWVEGSALRLKVNLNTGAQRQILDPPMPRLKVDAHIDSGVLRLRGHRLTYAFRCESEEQLRNAVGTLHLVIPPMLSLALPNPVFAASTLAKVGPVAGRWLQTGGTAPMLVHTPASFAAAVERALKSLPSLLEQANRRLLAAVHYYHVAERLRAAGCSQWEFAAEAILNYCKALEALFGPRWDPMRRQLKALGYGRERIEGTFIPILLLRSHLDVAHVRLRQFEADSLDKVYRFLPAISVAIQDLFGRVLALLANGGFRLRPPPPRRASAKDRRGLARVLESISAKGGRFGAHAG